MKISRKRTTQWNLFFHYLSIALMMVSGVLLVPLYLRDINLELYGAWLATGNILFWLSAIDPGLSSILQQRVATAFGKSDYLSINSFIFSGLLVSTVITLFLLMFGYILSDYLPILLNVTKSLDREILIQAFWIAVIGSSLQLFSYSVTSINQGLQSSLGIGVIYAIVHVLDILLILIFLKLGYGLMALAYSALWRGIGMASGNIIYLGWRMNREQIALTPSFIKVRELVSIMPFTFLSQSSGVVASNLDAFIAARFLGAELVPVIVLSRKAFDICRMIISRPVMATTPALSHLISEGGLDRARDVLIRLTYIMVWGMFLVAGGLLSFNEAFLHFWVGTNMYAGDDINYLLCLGFIFTAMTTSLSFVLIALGQIKSTSTATLLQSLVFMLTLVIGTKYFGLIGLVSAPILSMGLVGAWYFPRLFIRLLNLNQNKLNLIFRELIGSLLTAAIVSIGFMFFETSSLMVFVIQLFLYIIIYCFILGFLSGAFRSECINFYRSFSIKQSSY